MDSAADKNSIAIFALVFDEPDRVDTRQQNGRSLRLQQSLRCGKLEKRDDFTQYRCKMVIMGVTLNPHATLFRRGRDE